jgi:hypothetical protein
MRVNLVASCQENCANAPLIEAYAEQRTAREIQVGQANPDVVISIGSISCSGCGENPAFGRTCNARLAQTQFHIQGEQPPRPEEAHQSMLEVIPSFQIFQPDIPETA